MVNTLGNIKSFANYCIWLKLDDVCLLRLSRIKQVVYQAFHVVRARLSDTVVLHIFCGFFAFFRVFTFLVLSSCLRCVKNDMRLEIMGLGVTGWRGQRMVRGDTKVNNE